ncbi:MAG: hypothetical protein PUK31_06280, partial [Candidatus Methanomethylophilaceae archaeon]|nr:hypothetical protein [Candidatus Methanomethylophilaceae archaeon]
AMCTPRGMFAGLVLEASYLGTISTYRVDCEGVILNIQVSCRNMHAVGDIIRFNIDSSMVWPVDPPKENVRVDKVEHRRNGVSARIRSVIDKVRRR